MSKLMTVDVLSSIKGAKESEAVNQLFDVIKTANFVKADSNLNVVELGDLRDDVVVKSSELERKIIKDNFPKQKNGFLMVNKIIEE